MIPLIAKIAIGIVGKLLPEKPKEVIQAMVNEVIVNDAEIQKQIQAFRQFVLDYEGRAELMPKVVNILRAIPRPIITLTVLVILFKYLWLGIVMPKELWYLSAGVFAFYFGLRYLEKKNGGIQIP